MEDSPFAIESGFRRGYKKSQVDEFLALARKEFNRDLFESTDFNVNNVRVISFDQVRGGYQFFQVDATLERLEYAFILREKERFIALEGEAKWNEYLYNLLKNIKLSLQRPSGRMFKRANSDEISYKVRDVEKFCEILRKCFFEETTNVTVKDVREIVFRTVKGRRGYAEEHVDFFLDKVIKFLAATE